MKSIRQYRRSVEEMKKYRNSDISSDFYRKFYNETVKGRYRNDYEFFKWFAPEHNDYSMTYRSIVTLLGGINFRSCVEMGPGPGTWTAVVYKANPKAKFHLYDVSEEMKQQFAINMREKGNVDYTITDFMKAKTPRADLFFSVRAVEYLKDKKAFVDKLWSAISDGGSGLIITKNPSYIVYRLKPTPKYHSLQISPAEFRELLKARGFRNVQVYPVVIKFPLLSKRMWKRSNGRPLRGMVSHFCESYAVRFEK